MQHFWTGTFEATRAGMIAARFLNKLFRAVDDAETAVTLVLDGNPLRRLVLASAVWHSGPNCPSHQGKWTACCFYLNPYKCQKLCDVQAYWTDISSACFTP